MIDQVWIMIFTSINYDRTTNNEKAEHIGDRALDYFLVDYISQRFPNLSVKTASRMKTTFVNNKYLASLARDRGFTPHLRYQRDPTIPVPAKAYADLFEAFIQGITLVGNKLQPGAGILLAFNYLTQIFSEVSMDPKIHGSIDDTTFVDQIFNRLGIGKPSVVSETFDAESGRRAYRTVISLGEEILNFFRERKFENMSGQLGSATATTSQLASKQAYSIAASYLRSMGVSEEWAKKMRTILDFEDPLVKDLAIPSQNKAKQEGYDGLSFRVNARQTNDTTVTIALDGVKDGKRYQLFQIEAPRNLYKTNATIHRLLLEYYLQGRFESEHSSVRVISSEMGK